ncbi:unnamed protein product [marine sediment metagenome]|uniref:Uncharacterized protein n=1 Tax=marine sediment metagenome TaxID=412755 RepID=X0U301_9ZZZZ
MIFIILSIIGWFVFSISYAVSRIEKELDYEDLVNYSKRHSSNGYALNKRQWESS